jgi:iron complex transport system substrate-binding protein
VRVASLLPAATEIVAAIGGVELLVGVSHECDFPPQVRALPRITFTRLDGALPSREIDREMAAAKRSGMSPIETHLGLLAQLRPDVLIGQSLCDVCAVGGSELERAVAGLDPRPAAVTLHPHTVSDVLADVLTVGDALGLREEACAVVARLRERLDRLRARVGAPAHRPRVLVLEWIDPPYVAGHWVPELIALAGGCDVGGAAGAPSGTRTWAELATLAPDLVIVALCGFDVTRARKEVAAVSDRDARRVLGRRVEFLDGNAYTSRPGPRLVDAAELLAELIAR